MPRETLGVLGRQGVEHPAGGIKPAAVTAIVIRGHPSPPCGPPGPPRHRHRKTPRATTSQARHMVHDHFYFLESAVTAQWRPLASLCCHVHDGGQRKNLKRPETILNRLAAPSRRGRQGSGESPRTALKERSAPWSTRQAIQEFPAIMQDLPAHPVTERQGSHPGRRRFPRKLAVGNSTGLTSYLRGLKSWPS